MVLIYFYFNGWELCFGVVVSLVHIYYSLILNIFLVKLKIMEATKEFFEKFDAFVDQYGGK